MSGSRKLKGFYHTLYGILLLTVASMTIGGVNFAGENITTIIIAVSALAGAFFGANFGEHYSKALAAKNGGVVNGGK